MLTKSEWINHFDSVSNIMGIYEGEYWDVVRFDKCWKIIGKQMGHTYISADNGGREEYTEPDKILRILLIIEPIICVDYKRND